MANFKISWKQTGELDKVIRKMEISKKNPGVTK